MKRTEYIKSVNSVIEAFDRSNHLFCGGCCFAAAEIARVFEEHKIAFEVVCFQAGDCVGIKDFNALNNKEDLAHVAIRVRVENTKMFIGSVHGVETTLNAYCEKWEARTYKNISSKDLMKMYEDNEWNDIWDTNLNDMLSIMLNLI